ncbi:hypothetical protein V6N11_004428 [Hibiscus sabdariffa]|uniref:Uncharacterized protein n=1 Tax=Hibiscus sabdariffa TaxID=183260 RepID=A0ABR2SGJ7_9ROSI
MLKALSSKVSSVARAARELRQQHVQWHKINIDKGQRLHDGTAACGGIIQDDTFYMLRSCVRGITHMIQLAGMDDCGSRLSFVRDG